jgi:hypothetical protein
MLTIIVGRSFEHGRNWLRENYQARKLDPQTCRVLTNPDAFKGLEEFHVIWLKGWSMGPKSHDIQQEFILRLRPGSNITEEWEK